MIIAFKLLSLSANEFDLVCLYVSAVSDQLGNIVCIDIDTSFNKFKIE